MLTVHSKVVAIPDQVFSKLADEVVILSMKDGVYYGLNAVGAYIWEFIQNPRSVEEILDRLLSEYEVGAERCERETLALLRDLHAHGLIHVNGEIPADASSGSGG